MLWTATVTAAPPKPVCRVPVADRPGHCFALALAVLLGNDGWELVHGLALGVPTEPLRVTTRGWSATGSPYRCRARSGATLRRALRRRLDPARALRSAAAIGRGSAGATSARGSARCPGGSCAGTGAQARGVRVVCDAITFKGSIEGFRAPFRPIRSAGISGVRILDCIARFRTREAAAAAAATLRPDTHRALSGTRQ